MKKFSLALLAMATALAITPAALADTIEYSTSSTSTLAPTSGTGMTLTFTGVTDDIINNGPSLTPTNSSLGNFTITGAATYPGETFSDVPFTLTIDQSDPSSGTENFTSTLSGDIYTDGSSLVVTWNQSSVTIGQVTYALESYPTITLNNGSTEDSTSINATITETPEPSSLLLLGTGLLGLAFVAFRKAKPARSAMKLSL